MNALPKISSLIALCCAMNVTHAQEPHAAHRAG